MFSKKKICILSFITVLVLFMTTACSGKSDFDAEKAAQEVMYYVISGKVVEDGSIDTVRDSEYYIRLWNEETESLIADIIDMPEDLSNEQKNDMTQILGALASKARYEVSDVEKRGKKYEVEITITPIKGPADYIRDNFTQNTINDERAMLDESNVHEYVWEKTVAYIREYEPRAEHSDPVSCTITFEKTDEGCRLIDEADTLRTIRNRLIA